MEFLTSYLNNAANDDDIRNGTSYANSIGVSITMPKWGFSKGDYFFDNEKRVIAKGLSSIKYMGPAIAEELYNLAQTKVYKHFVDLLKDLDANTSLDTRQRDILIKLDFFSEFGNQRELLRIVEMFELFKKGDAKQIKRSEVEGTFLEDTVKRHAVGTTKSGGIAKSYTLLDVMAILREIEDAIKAANMDDLSDITKVRNFADVMGYIGYVSGLESDRRKLYITNIYPINRKRDGKQCGYTIQTKSIGSGKESRFSVWNRVFDKDPIRVGDIIYCKSFERDGQYFTLKDYHHIY